MMQELQAYYDQQFSSSHDTGSIYDPMTALIEAAHLCRLQILDHLPIGDLTDRVVVDFGTGSWGFACIYPRLHRCKRAIGMDISAEAVKISSELSANGCFPYGNNYEYQVSDGIEIPLPSGSVDLFFTGECIEHVENTDAFLDEIYRVLTREGLLILTTPNAEALTYRAVGDRYALGPEHIALMSYDELCGYLEPRFSMIVSKGYNSSLHTLVDDGITDAEFARRWAWAFQDRPRDACGVVMMLEKREGYKPRKYVRRTFQHSDPSVRYVGEVHERTLHRTLSGSMIRPGAEARLNFAGEELVVLLWTHPWSGRAELQVDALVKRVDCYAHVGGFTRVIFRGLDSASVHHFTLRAVGEQNPRSGGDEVILFSVSAYDAA